LQPVGRPPLGCQATSLPAQVRALSPAFELVITAGGLGPTPDDVTMAGIAASLGTTLKRDATLEVLLASYHVHSPFAQHRCASSSCSSTRLVQLTVPTQMAPTTCWAQVRLRAYFGPHITPAHLKLAEVPDGEALHVLCLSRTHVFGDPAGRKLRGPSMLCRTASARGLMPGSAAVLQARAS